MFLMTSQQWQSLMSFLPSSSSTNAQHKHKVTVISMLSQQISLKMWSHASQWSMKVSMFFKKCYWSQGDIVVLKSCHSRSCYLGVQSLVQGRFNMWSRWAWNQTTDPAVCGKQLYQQSHMGGKLYFNSISDIRSVFLFFPRRCWQYTFVFVHSSLAIRQTGGDGWT